MATQTGLIEQFTRQGLSGKAIELLRIELAKHPDDAHLHALLAVNLLRERRVAAAEHEALIALKAEPERAMSHLVLGHVLLARQRYEQALGAFKDSIALDPSSSEAHVGLGRCHEALGDLVAAEASYNEARGLDPQSSGPHYRLAAMALERRDLDSAELAAEEALSLEPEDPDNLVLMGVVRYQQWKLPEALDLCLQALRINPEHGEARRLLCWLKAREMPIIAPWWHFSGTMGRLDQHGRIWAMVTMFLVYRLIFNILTDLGFEQVALYLRWVWLAFCVYTWFSPAIFEWLVEREKKKVELKDDF